MEKERNLSLIGFHGESVFENKIYLSTNLNKKIKYGSLLVIEFDGLKVICRTDYSPKMALNDGECKVDSSLKKQIKSLPTLIKFNQLSETEEQVDKLLLTLNEKSGIKERELIEKYLNNKRFSEHFSKLLEGNLVINHQLLNLDWFGNDLYFTVNILKGKNSSKITKSTTIKFSPKREEMKGINKTIEDLKKTSLLMEKDIFGISSICNQI